MSSAADFLVTLAAARQGESEALDELVVRFYPTVRHKVHLALAGDLRQHRPWLVSLFSTGDVVQEVFHDVVRDLESFQGETEPAFISYLTTVIKNRLIDAIRFHEAARRDRRRDDARIEGADFASPARSPSNRVEEVEELEHVARVLSSFPTRERHLLRERLEKASTFDELAEQLGYRTSDAARKAFYTAQARLLIRLKQMGVRGHAE